MLSRVVAHQEGDHRDRQDEGDESQEHELAAPAERDDQAGDDGAADPDLARDVDEVAGASEAARRGLGERVGREVGLVPQAQGYAVELVAQAGVARDAQVHATGISTIDSDSATALVAGTFTDSYAKGGEAAPAPFRIEVTLVKTHGEWLVDNFSPVTAE